MLVTHTMRSTLELMVFVVARKMLIYTDSMMEIILGTIALAIIFATIKYLIPSNLIVKRIKELYSGDTTLSAINNFTDLTIYGDNNLTINEFLHSKLSNSEIKPDKIYDAGTIKIRIVSVEDNEIKYVEILEENFISK